MSNSADSKGAVVAVANSIATAVIGIFVGMLLAQNMVMKEYGEFSAAYSAVGIIALLSGVGFKSLVLRVYARGENMDDYVHLRGFRKMAPVIIIIASFFFPGCLSFSMGSFIKTQQLR